MKNKGAILVTALAALAVGVVSQGCSSSKPSSGFGGDNSGNGSSGSGGGTTGGDGSGGVGPIGNGGGPNFADAGLHTNDGGDGMDGGCATTTAKASREAVYMLVVLDGSGSMSMNPRTNKPEQKWVAAQTALDAFFDDLNAHPDNGFGVGITVFSDQNDPYCTSQYGILFCDGPYPNMNVPIAFVDANQAHALHNRLDSTKPVDGTPTVAVLQGQYPALEQFQASAPLPKQGKRILVLMTDGVPNDNNNTPTGQLQQTCIDLASQEVSKGITTFVVGIGNYAPLDTANYDPAFLGQLAKAGGAPNPGCDPNNTTDPAKMCHFQITPGSKSAQQLEQEFLAAINAIRGQVASCTFSLDMPDGGSSTVDPTKVNVVYNDDNGKQSTIPQDPQNGWTYDDPTNPTSVSLHGSSCDTLKNSNKGSVEIVLGCKTVVK